MVIALYEDAPQTAQTVPVAFLPAVALDAKKLAIWIVAAAIPWGIIIGGVRLVVAALS